MAGLTGRALIASRCAKFFKDGDFVNLGIGLPLLCVNYLPEGVLFGWRLRLASSAAAPLPGGKTQTPISSTPADSPLR